MKLKFKHQAFQDLAVEAVADCFAGQPLNQGLNYRIDPGKVSLKPGEFYVPSEHETGFKNAELVFRDDVLLSNIQAVQQRQNLPLSSGLATNEICKINLDVEMETGTGKTYCYIKSMFELNRRYGWNKFIVMVPSIAIREGVYKSLEITAEHFLESYGKRARYFIYDSKQLHHLEHFSSDSGINVMIINVQAFNATGKDNRRIYEVLDEFQSRRPIDVISANRPILILDEPQKMEGDKTLKALTKFNPLMVLRYSATHKTTYNKIHRLDALDAYNQKLVKKIAVRGISVKGQGGSSPYLYLESIEISASKPPVARIELEIRQGGTIKRVLRKLERNDNLFEKFGELQQYRGYVVAEIDARTDTVSFTNGVELHAGEALGDVNESLLRRIQIRESIKAHLEKEQKLFNQGIKVLSLFFIDEVAKYRAYDASGEKPGVYAQIFEEEYNNLLPEQLEQADPAYQAHLKKFDAARLHNGYFSIDKKSKRLVDPAMGKKATEADDVDAYDLILKDKERLLSQDEPVRFIFSHSALREGWDNPNVFVICTLKHSDNVISRRQEVGRGLRLAVNQQGERMDDPATVHDLNVLTVIANESYKDFVTGLQKDISESLSARPRVADEAYFTGKAIETDAGRIVITPQMARQIYRYLTKNDYSDDNNHITAIYHEAKQTGQLASLPPELAPVGPQIIQLIDSVFSDLQLPEIIDDRRVKENPTNANFDKREFRELWDRINRKAAYTVQFETQELIDKCVAVLDLELKVTPLHYRVQSGVQAEEIQAEQLKQGKGFLLQETANEWQMNSVHSGIRYDLLGKLASETGLTRQTLATILKAVKPDTFAAYVKNPEEFLGQTARLISEQIATVIIEHISYDPLHERHELEIFTKEKSKVDFSKAFKAQRHVYDYVFTDSAIERAFVQELDTSTEVKVYAKLPKGFQIPTPVGNYNPDWAIAFEAGRVRHVYFVAETKGSLSSLELRQVEASKIACARRFFASISQEQVSYEVVDSYSKLMELVN